MNVPKVALSYRNTSGILILIPMLAIHRNVKYKLKIVDRYLMSLNYMVRIVTK